MATRILVVISLALAAAFAQPIPQNQNGSVVPGVFISTDALKNLQEKAQQNQNQPITNQGPGRASGLSPSSQSEEPKIGSTYPTNSQNIPANNGNQPTIIASQPVLSQPTVSNQPIVLPQSQPQYVAQVLPNQPSNQAIMMTQPGNQAILVQQPGYNQQQPVYVTQPAGTQFVAQPNQQVVLSNGQVAQIVSTNGQPLINNGQPFVNNGQPFGNQPLYVTNSGTPTNNQPVLVNPGNQVTLVQQSPNPVQNPSQTVQYTVVPTSNNMATLPNNNGNTYLMVPNTNQVYTVSNG